MKPYQLLDSGNGKKLEAFGEIVLIRPCQQALWLPSLDKSKWDSADAIFSREGGNDWQVKKNLPSSWLVEIEGLSLKASPTDFGHLGIFPEHHKLWNFLKKQIVSVKDFHFLNLFAYSGAASLIAARHGAKVCHVDASKPMTLWAKENAKINNLQNSPIRWIIDDAVKFLRREQKRGVFYDGILLDPPSFGRGPKKEVFKIEEEIISLLQACRDVLKKGLTSFFILSSHTPGFTPIVLANLLQTGLRGLDGEIVAQELTLQALSGMALPCGSFAIWSAR